MANAVASSSRDRTAQPRTSLHSLHSVHQYNPNQAVVMTDEIIRRRPASGLYIKIVNQYGFKVKVGKGQHGEVFLAENVHHPGSAMAVKAVRRKNKSDRLRKLRRNDNIPRQPHLPLVDQLGSTEHKIRKEIAIMKKLNHPHVVRLLEVIDDPLNDKIYMVMEYLGGGEIKWRTASDNPLLRVDQTRRICRDVILGLEYLHYQGIIHRDIKPANLLWTADRRTVKISDFGVSTFSYAQRLAAAGKGNIKHDDTDPILMDESDLSKTAGTPMFLAPEIIADASESAYHLPLPFLPHPHRSSSSQSQTQTQVQMNASNKTPTPTQGTGTAVQVGAQTPRKKPPITKAIDIWAFGVTLYGLLFGTLPFHAGTEFEIYKVIRTQDWDVPAVMGLDRIPTGGRHPEFAAAAAAKKNGPAGRKAVLETDGAQVMDLLERLLEKNAARRITLERVKRHPWILRDLEKPEEWLRETQLTQYIPLEPTHDETSSAMSAVRFRWLPRIGNRILSTLRSVKPQRSFRRGRPRDDRDEQDEVGVRSAPHYVHVVRQQPASATIASGAATIGSPRQLGSVRERKRRSRQDLARNKSTNDIGSKPVDGSWASSPGAGSSKGKSVDTSLRIPSQSSRITSPAPSPSVGPSSMATSPVGEHPPSDHLPDGASPRSDRPQSMVMQWVRKLGGSSRMSSYSNYPSLMTESAVNLALSGRLQYRDGDGRMHPVAATSPPSRDSADAMSGHATSRQSSMSMSIGGKLSKAMRAASWTAPDFAQARPSEDMTSLYSGDRPEDLDEEVLMYGAGGVAGSPVPSVPNSALLSTVSSMHSIGPALVVRPRMDEQHPEASDHVNHCHSHSHSHSHSRSRAGISPSSRSRTTSPLAKVTYRTREESPSSGSDDDDSDENSYDSADDGSSILDHQTRGRTMLVNQDPGDAHSFEGQPSTSQMYHDEDEDSDSEEAVPLEVRTRRPSQSAADMTSPRRSLSASAHPAAQAGKQRTMICT
ncbi:hypothetical protein GSI_02257 [Ganoderma sinense ZZ0214-1]|uniref:Protein kinase domain-containing protein n=1 Tax=Ganoderma sinense ZZ0214-1 TaxID=1077348 RepID=A0A2G8SP46_9APHY|nr:hypothetical protein GSI_02257 [Ganoderma sinense ZZ0214-1]